MLISSNVIVTFYLFNIENLVLGARSEFNGFAGTSGDLFWSTGVLECWQNESLHLT